MGILEYGLVALISAGGSFVQRVTGFGLSIFAMLFLPYVLPNNNMAVAIMGIVGSVGTIYNAVVNRKDIRLKIMLPLVGSAMVVIPLAVKLSAELPQSVMVPLLGVVLIVLSVYFLFFSKRIHLKPTVPNGLVAGALAGLLNGLFNTGGPPAVLFLIHATSDKAVYFATLQAFFAATNTFSTVNRAINGLITPTVLGLSAVALVGWWLGNSVGDRVFQKLNADLLRKLVYWGMIVSGALMIV